MTPIMMAFPELYIREISIFDNCMNIVFTIDILLNFFVAYYDEDFIVVDTNKVYILFYGNNYRKSQKTTSLPGSSETLSL